MGRPRILVVDDEAAVRTFVERVLCRAGCDVMLAASGAEALVIAQRESPIDLFVLDLHMPDMNGDELARELRTTEPDIKVLYFTGYSGQLFKERSMLRWGYEAYLDKPVTVEGLLEVVSLLLFKRIDGLPLQVASTPTQGLTDPQGIRNPAQGGTLDNR
jgi:two-component system cell cycle sensor histidine kinase/response regulator CckA